MIRLFKVAMSPTLFHGVPSMSADRGFTNPLLDTLASGYIGQGPQVEKFEQALEEKFLLPRRPVTTNSCTSALDLALELIGVGPGDAVITTPQTCTATNTPIVKRHAIPVWADINQRGLVTAESVNRAWMAAKDEGLNVKAVMVVDWAGARPDIPRIRRVLPDNMPIIEDAAHRLPGPSEADYTAWSFQAIKYLTTGDGGALQVPAAQQKRAKLLRWYGLDRETKADFRCEQNIAEVGFKYHMNDIAASIGLANLPLALANLVKQRANAHYLASRLGQEFDRHSHYWFYPWLTRNRDAFVARLAAEGIEASQVHARNDKHTGFQYPRRLPGVDLFDSHQIAIPCGWWLSDEDLDHVVESIRAFQEGDDAVPE
jgi:dTDP-4-amino-4,6-dideoxygalactose transaminase